MKAAVTLALLLALIAVPVGASAVRDTNLIQNGSFESTLTGWRGFNAKLSIVAGGTEGTHAARVTATGAGTITIYSSPRTVSKTVAGTVYAAVASAKGTVGKRLCVGLREWASSPVGSNASCVTANGAWQSLGPVTYTANGTGDSLETQVYEAQGVVGDTFKVDGLSLTSAASATTPPPPPAPAPASAGGAAYVSPDGSDSNPGTADAPWRTLQHAFGRLAPGSTLYLRAGTYPDWVTESVSGTESAPITITAYPGEQPVITGRFKLSGSWVTVSQLRFLGSTAANSNGVLVYVSGADHVSLVDDELTHANMSAIYAGDPGNGSDYLTIARDWIHDNGTHTNHDHGIYLGTGAHGAIVDDVITGNFARGIQCYPDCDYTLIANNTVAGNARAGIQVGDESGESSDGNTIVNNVVASNGDVGIRSYWGGAAGVGNVARDNLSWGNSGGNTAGPGIDFSGNLSVDPHFVGSGDYQLTAGSPALDVALTSYAPALDFLGHARGALPDLGAYER